MFAWVGDHLVVLGGAVVRFNVVCRWRLRFLRPQIPQEKSQESRAMLVSTCLFNSNCYNHFCVSKPYLNESLYLEMPPPFLHFLYTHRASWKASKAHPVSSRDEIISSISLPVSYISQPGYPMKTMWPTYMGLEVVVLVMVVAGQVIVDTLG